MSSQQNENKLNIPIVTDVVVPGNPEMKRLAQEKLAKEGHAALKFQHRINEVESAIGQDEGKSLSRAHAIRAELAAS